MYNVQGLAINLILLVQQRWINNILTWETAIQGLQCRPIIPCVNTEYIQVHNIYIGTVDTVSLYGVYMFEIWIFGGE